MGQWLLKTFLMQGGELLEKLRKIVGGEIPIAITLNLHANVTEKMCQNANIIVSYKIVHT